MTAKYAFVSAERNNHAVGTLCRVLGVSVSGFYAWLHAIPSLQSRAEAEAELRGHIGRIFAARRRAPPPITVLLALSDQPLTLPQTSPDNAASTHYAISF